MGVAQTVERVVVVHEVAGASPVAHPTGGHVRTIIAGSRKRIFRSDVDEALENCPFESQILSVVWGMAPGVDTMGFKWATERNIPTVPYPADWDRFRKRAGFIRNQQMAENADALVVVWDGKSRGSKDMLQRAERMGLRVFQWIPERFVNASGQAKLI